MNVCREYSVICHLANDLGYCASTACTRHLEIDVVPQPNKNLVEVVRCKECKWAKANGTYQWCGRLDSTARITADDFCSYGEREGE